MSDKDPTTCQGLSTNPDISGIGVRTSFYLQTLILVLIVDRSWEEASGSLLTCISTSFGLTLAALVQAIAGRLTLYQALQVSHLTFLANISTFLALASYSRKPKADTLVKFAAVIQAYFSMSLTLSLWIMAPHFGSQPECNESTKIILFGVQGVLGSTRTAVTVIISFLIVLYTVVTVDEFKQWRHRREQEKQDEEIAMQATGTRAREAAPSRRTDPSSSTVDVDESDAPGGLRKSRLKGRKKRERWLFQEVDAVFFGISVSQIIILIYFVTVTELLIKYNEPPETETHVWGFGQILAMVVLAPSLVTLIQALKTYRVGKRKKRSHPDTK